MKENYEFRNVYRKAFDICNKMGIFIVLNRNLEDRNKVTFYKENYFIPVINQLIGDLEIRVTKNEKNMASIGNLLTPKEIDYFHLAESFGTIICPPAELMSPESLAVQIELEHNRAKIVGTTSQQALERTQNTYGIIHNLLRILLTYPLTVASAERSFSMLRRVLSYLRSSRWERSE